MDIDAYRRKRLRELVDKESKGNVAAFARTHNQDAARLRQVLNQNYRDGKSFGEGVARRLEADLGLPALYFDLGIEKEILSDHNLGSGDLPISAPKEGVFKETPKTPVASIDETNDAPGPKFHGKIPLISWAQARTWEQLVDTFAQKDAQEWLDCPVPHATSSFCISNDSDAMDDGTPNGYREGEILFVDPSVIAIPGKDVVVRMLDGKMLFRRLKEDSEGLYLFGLNGRKITRYPEGATTVGVVIFSGVRR
ncbi:LexA family transcriptional regulator [Paraburkholderia fungorum]|uniref:LexA family protein n=1 Tax=Paraburkholderia fungorum TaxID=134537 RepID=UPI0011B1DEF4|nr:S24 family peptidase [Paraburkholderia fungorum]